MNDNIWSGNGKRIYMQEVGTRDGLQVEEAFVAVVLVRLPDGR